MATQIQNDEAHSVSSLVGGILQDAQELFKQQIQLFKTEVRADVRKLRAGAQLTGAGALVALVACMLLGMALAFGLQAAFPHWPLWACFAACGGLYLVIGGALYWAGYLQLVAVDPLAAQTGETLEENIQWITNRK